MSSIVTRSATRKRKEREEEEQKATKRAPPPKPPVELCVLCNKQKACFGYTECKDLDYCFDCFREAAVWKPTTRTCVRCNKSTRLGFFVNNMDAATAAKYIGNQFTHTSSAALFAVAIDAVFDTCAALRLTNAEPIQTAILNQYRSYARHSSNFPLISVDQCEGLLMKADRAGFYRITNGHRIRNVLVSFCRHPWLVSMDQGSHGVCYHGNLGEIPSIASTFELLLYNRAYAMGVETYF